MRNYLDLAPKYLSGHKNKTRLTIFSVVMAVALVVGIFSMLDALVKFETAQVLKSEGNYHILVRDPTQNEMDIIGSRIDVENSGLLKDLGEGKTNDEICALGYISESFAGNLNIDLIEGNMPRNDREVVLEKWYLDQQVLNSGDTIKITRSDGTADD